MQFTLEIPVVPKDHTLTSITCRHCKTRFYLAMPDEKMAQYQDPAHPHIQDIFPDMTASDRELLISRLCGACWESLFNEDDSIQA